MFFSGSQLIGFGGRPGTLTSWAKTLNVNTGGVADGTTRTIAVSAVPTGLEIRVRFEAGSLATWAIDNAAIGIRNSGPDTLLTPVELKFGGVSGFSLSAGATIFSDWLAFPFSGKPTFVVVMDHTTGTGASRTVNTGGDDIYFKSTADSYNQATVVGMTHLAGWAACANLIEVR